MIGHVESYDDERQTGAIKCEDKFYEFHIDDWGLDKEPEVGDDVDFMPEDDGSATGISSIDGVVQHTMIPVKRRVIAALLGLFFGFLGTHRIYLGFYRTAFFQILLTGIMLFLGAPGFAMIWGFIEGFLIFGGLISKDAKGRSLK
ncbi:MAG: NINE protein [Methylococcales symbiont of Hymedesmia sp. n. MRB-2018]|nr:MAG: NINE protein [Methylococcales symbiont of Hymedesmia sp. n. MRB-2018]KAF3984403.1 MAG: NINE protein [Methylococcales symbiont of Hymedesmia sp. n. MRB-2018]